MLEVKIWAWRDWQHPNTLFVEAARRNGDQIETGRLAISEPWPPLAQLMLAAIEQLDARCGPLLAAVDAPDGRV